MKRFHIALSVEDFSKSIEEYSQKLESRPSVIVDGEYALWRKPTLNFSIRKVDQSPGTLRHLGWEDPSAEGFTSEKDCNGVLWENFRKEDQEKEILEVWPDAKLN